MRGYLKFLKKYKFLRDSNFKLLRRTKVKPVGDYDSGTKDQWNYSTLEEAQENLIHPDNFRLAVRTLVTNIVHRKSIAVAFKKKNDGKRSYLREAMEGAVAYTEEDYKD